MIDVETYYKAKKLREKGMKRDSILNELKINKKSYYRYTFLDEETFMFMHKQFKENDIENYRDFIISILSVTPNVYNSTIFYRALEEFQDFKVSRNTFFRYIERVRAESGYMRKAIRYHERETEKAMGYEAQVDFGQYVMRDMYGKRVRVYFFCMVLTYSRMMFAYFSREPFTAKTAVEAHTFAFKYYGGRPQNILYDQDRVFVVSELFKEFTLVKEFDKFVREVGFTVELCHKYDPNTKGKIENVVKNIKRKFLDGRIYNGIDSLNSDFLAWVDMIGNNDVNYTTKKTPRELFREESTHLEKVYHYEIKKPYILTLDENNLFELKGNSYQVPEDYNLAKCRVKVVERDDRIYVYREFEDESIIDFQVAEGVGRVVGTNKRGSILNQMNNELELIFKDNTYFVNYIGKIDLCDISTQITQKRRVLRLARYYKKEELIEAFRFCVRNGKCRVTEVISFLIARYGEKKAKPSLNGKALKPYTRRIKQIKELINNEY